MKRIIAFASIVLLLLCGVAHGQPIGPGGIYGGSSSSSGSVATDAIWDAAGDTVYGTGANTGARLAKGTAYQLYMMNSGATAPAWTSTLGATGTRLTKGWFTDLETTNQPTIGGVALNALFQAIDADLTSWAGITAPTVAAAGDIVVGSGPNALTVISKGSNNSLFGVNNSGTLGFYTNIKTDDSAAQFYSATASKGTFKVLLTSMSDGILGTLAPVCTGACVLTTETYGAGTYTLADKTSTQTLTNKTLGGGSDDPKVVLRENTTDGTWNGITLNRTCAAATAFGVPVYIDSNGKAAKANAAAAATMPAIGLVVVAAAQANDPCTILTHGTITEDDWTWTAGNTIYVDDSAAGVLTATVGDVSGTDHVVQIMGIALSDDTIFVNPSLTTITLE